MRLIKSIKNELRSWLEMFFSLIPGAVGLKLRKLFYGSLFKSCGKNFFIGMLARIQQPQAITIGNNVRFNDYAWIAANENGGGITVGNNTIIGPRVMIHTGNHVYKNKTLPIFKQGYKFEPINIMEDVWIGSNVSILQGVTIGKGAIVAAGSVVTKNVEEFSIVGGIPANKIGMR